MIIIEGGRSESTGAQQANRHVFMFTHKKTLPKHMFFCILSIYKLDTKTKGSTRFRNPRARGGGVPREARALLRAQGFLNRVDPIGRGV